MLDLLDSFWSLVIESAPWLLLGYFLAGVIKQLLPTSLVESQLSSPGIVSIVKAALIGAPLPLCSCGVIPTALAVRKAGASKGATSAFLVATPETGVDSISFSYAVLGPVFAIARPISALISAIVAGVMVSAVDKDESPIEREDAKSSCCSSKQALAEAELSFAEKLVASIKYGYGRMISDTAKWLIIGLVGAAVVTTFVPQSFFLQWGDGLMAMIVMVIVGLPMYICATASTPVAASLLFAGISPGAALVFMLTGPATNIATMGVIKDQLGVKALVAYLISVIGTAIACGLLLNLAYQQFGWSLQLNIMDHGETIPLWRHTAAIALAALVLRVYAQPLFERFKKHAAAAN
ncbi:MAG: uncharacterized membrane protein YraQ (UPF0718 family) [Pseudohongiellaceae bacterium]|jgi:uncharacterized membrane protein YraQ (UPF0718 family)